MAFFKNRFTKEGPGIPKDLPPKKGLRLFFDILFREFWELIKLNLTFVLFILPGAFLAFILYPLGITSVGYNPLVLAIIGLIVTLFAAPALGGLTYATMKMIRDEPIYVWHDFVEGYKKNWKQSLVAGLMGLIAVLSIYSSFYLWATQGSAVFFALGMFINLIAGITYVYVYPMIVLIDLPFVSSFKNAFLLGVYCLKHSLPALLICEAILLAAVIFIYFALPVFILILFALINFIACFAAWPGIKANVIRDETDSEDDDEATLLDHTDGNENDDETTLLDPTDSNENDDEATLLDPTDGSDE